MDFGCSRIFSASCEAILSFTHPSTARKRLRDHLARAVVEMSEALTRVLQSDAVPGVGECIGTCTGMTDFEAQPGLSRPARGFHHPVGTAMCDAVADGVLHDGLQKEAAPGCQARSDPLAASIASQVPQV